MIVAISEPLDRYKLVVGMILCSHQVTQNPAVHSLIHWEQKLDILPDTLNKFPFVEMKDVLQCFIPIVRALLEIIEEQPKMQMFAYNTLIFVLGLLIDDKTDRFSMWMDKLDQIISPDLKTVHQTLVRCMLYYLSKLDSTSHAKFIRITIRSLPHLMKLLTFCYLLIQNEQEKLSTTDDAFINDLNCVFKCLNNLMALKDPLKVALQSNCLQVFGELIPNVEKLYSADQLVDIVTDLLTVICNNESLSSSSLIIEQLILLQAIVNCDFYLLSDCSIVPDGLIDQIVQFLMKHLSGTRKQLIECSFCLSVLLDGVQRKGKRKEEAYELMIPLLRPLSAACSGLNYDSCNQLDLMTSFLSIIKGTTNLHIERYFNSLSSTERYSWLQALCSTAWKVLLNTYPPHWFTLYVFLFLFRFLSCSAKLPQNVKYYWFQSGCYKMIYFFFHFFVN